MEKRIIQLETIVAMQDETLAGLGAELYRQQQELARLARRIEALEGRLADLANPPPAAGDERPPHW